MAKGRKKSTQKPKVKKNLIIRQQKSQKALSEDNISQKSQKPSTKITQIGQNNGNQRVLRSRTNKNSHNLPNSNPQHSNDDIDIYFAPYVLTNKKKNEDDSIEKNVLVSRKQQIREVKNQSQSLKQEYSDDQSRKLNSYIQRFILCQNGTFQPQSPIFGQKNNTVFFTPPNKFEEYNDEMVIKKDLMDQLQEGQKIDSQSHQSHSHSQNIRPIQMITQPVSQPSITPSIQPIIQPTMTIQPLYQQQQQKPQYKSGKKKIKKEPSSHKNRRTKRQVDSLQNPEPYIYSFKREPENITQKSIKRRAYVLSVTALGKISYNYDKSYRLFKLFLNVIDGLLTYFNLRQINYDILSFRQGVGRIIKQETIKLIEHLGIKRDICFQTLQEKSKKINLVSEAQNQEDLLEKIEKSLK